MHVNILRLWIPLMLVSTAASAATLSICKTEGLHVNDPTQPVTVNAPKDGLVIVGEKTKHTCPGGIKNAWVVKKPGAKEVICASTLVPSNYVKTGDTKKFSCPILEGGNNAWIIERVGD